MAGCSGDTDTQEKTGIALAPGETLEQPNPDRNVYFGDLHIHTRNSFDAYIFNVRTTPEDAYKFGMGEGITHPSGYDLKLEGPALDFMAVTRSCSLSGSLTGNGHRRH